MLSLPVLSKMSCQNTEQMSCTEAEKKFWKTPELVEKIFPFLDLQSTLSLAQAHELTRKILEGSFVWKKLLKRSCLSDGVVFWAAGEIAGTLKEKLEVVKHLTAILKLMEDYEANLLDLLHTICKRGPPDVESRSYHGVVKLGCPCRPDPHLVLFSDFLLLEEVEGAFVTTEQTVETISKGGILEESSMSALSSRMSRQQKKVTSLSFSCVELGCKEGAEALKTLMQVGPEITEPYLEIAVPKAIGTEGWKALVEGMKLQPSLRLNCFIVLKDALDEAKKEDVRVIWEAVVDPSGRVSVDLDLEGLHGQPGDTFEEVEKTEGEAGWTRLAQILDLSKAEWLAQLKSKGGDGGEDEGGAEAEQEEEEGEDGLEDDDV